MKFLKTRDLFPLLVISLIKMANSFSSPLPKAFLVQRVASLAYCLSRDKRRLTERYLSEVLAGDLGEKERRNLIRSIFREFWRDKFSLEPSPSEKTAIQKAPIEGIGYLKEALEQGRGVILWESNSMGLRAVSKQILHERGFSIHQVYSDLHFELFLNNGPEISWVQHHLIGRTLEKIDRKSLEEIIYLPSSNSLAFVRILMDRLKRNAILCIPGDGSEGQRQVPVKFFGHTKLFPTGMVSLAKRSGATLLPLFCITGENGEPRLVIERPIDIPGDREQGFESGIFQYVHLLESNIRKYPKNYKKWHLLARGSENEIV
jgi:lauroyl/myristoyl acyltransferase